MNPEWVALESNPSLQGEKLVTNFLTHIIACPNVYPIYLYDHATAIKKYV
jgi:hypothetical protein